MEPLQFFILINGHEVIGKFVSETDTTITLEQPLGLQVVPQADGAYGLQLVPFSSVNAEGDHIFYKHAVCAEIQKIPDDIAKAYRQRTSRIVLV